MLLERAEIVVKSGAEDEFAADMRKRGVSLLSGVPGVKSVRFGRGVENPEKFLILVEWSSMEAHAAFRQMPVYSEFQEVFRGRSSSGAMEHFQVD